MLIAPAFNEEHKIGAMAERVPRDIVDKFLVVSDCSTDGTVAVAEKKGAETFGQPRRMGVGSAIRVGYKIAVEENFDIVLVIASNNKDNPTQIPRLLDPICDDGYDFVMGSRFLPGGEYGGDMPLYRVFATKWVHPMIVRLFCKEKVTETTNGFRALRVDVLRDERINLNQDWLQEYQLEMYLMMKVLMLDGIRTTEVPVSKIYPSRKVGNTKMKPIIGWWKMLYPIFLVGMGIRK